MDPVFLVVPAGVVGAIVMLLFLRTQRFPGQALPADPGPARATWRTGGRSGFFNYTRGLVTVSVHERGLVLKPFLGAVTWLPREAITAMTRETQVVSTGTTIRADGDELVLWTTDPEHAELVAWWRGG